ncbi:MAG: hypothetical protein BBJ60_05840 [Desulfobacterales bacterium S7086C20]|nr:MAG: hypothetical protein BBJ60_05840 [Desulfobacterales bacterium S7086C20]
MINELPRSRAARNSFKEKYHKAKALSMVLNIPNPDIDLLRPWLWAFLIRKIFLQAEIHTI